LEFTRQLKQQESKKTEENEKFQNVSRFIKKCDTIPQGRMHALDIKENVSRWLKRDTIW